MAATSNQPPKPRTVSVKGIFSHPYLSSKKTAKPTTSKKQPSSKKSDKKIAKSKTSSSSKHSRSKPRSKGNSTVKEHGSHQSGSGASQGNQKLLDRLSGSLETTRQGIIVNTAASLQDTKSNLDTKLQQLAKSHGTKLAAYQSKREILASAVKHAKAEPIAAPNDNNEALSAFSDTYKKEKKALSKLWKEWSKVQRKMICLGIEALGQGASLEDVVAAAGGKDMKKSYREVIIEAFTAYQEQAQEENRIERDEQRGIEEIKRICAETRAEAINLDKKLREEKRKQRQDVYQLAQKMLMSL